MQHQNRRLFITGATGFIGAQLAKQLAAQGCTVHALYRSEASAVRLKGIENLHLFKGDLLEVESLEKAMSGCNAVFHLAAYAKPWHKDPHFFYKMNVQGAENVFKTALSTGAKRVVFTSTAGVINPSASVPSDEDTPRTVPLSTHYEQSKAQAEILANSLKNSGLEIITVNPSRVYGPGLLSDSNGVTRMVKLYLEDKFRFLPGDGSSVGNYVFINDVVEGLLLAMQHGRPGERYILGGDNASFVRFFEILANVSNHRKRLFPLPIPVMQAAAKFLALRANLTGAPPLITPPFVKKYLHHWHLSSEKAIRELGYRPTGLEVGLERTVAWIRGE